MGKISFHYRTCPINSLIESSWHVHVPLLASPSITLTLTLSDSSWGFVCFLYQLRFNPWKILISLSSLLGILSNLGIYLKIGLLQRILKLDQDMILRVPESKSQTHGYVGLPQACRPSYQGESITNKKKNRILKFLKNRILLKSKFFFHYLLVLLRLILENKKNCYGHCNLNMC